MERASFHRERMKANPRLRSGASSILTMPVVAAAMLLTACVPQVAAPTPLPAATPGPAADWRDAPITPGDWQWSMANPGSTANFAGGMFVMHCNLPQRTVTLMRSANAAAPATMTITTTDTVRALAAEPVPGGVAVSVGARDPLLDSIAFSRGRFSVEVTGTAPLRIPSWTEISRVLEDCR